MADPAEPPSTDSLNAASSMEDDSSSLVPPPSVGDSLSGSLPPVASLEHRAQDATGGALLAVTDEALRLLSRLRKARRELVGSLADRATELEEQQQTQQQQPEGGTTGESESRQAAQNSVTECYTTILRLKEHGPILNRAIAALNRGTSLLASCAVPAAAPPTISPQGASLLLHRQQETFAQRRSLNAPSDFDATDGVQVGQESSDLKRRKVDGGDRDYQDRDARVVGIPGNVRWLSAQRQKVAIVQPLAQLSRFVRQSMNSKSAQVRLQLVHRQGAPDDRPSFLRLGVRGVFEVFIALRRVSGADFDGSAAPAPTVDSDSDSPLVEFGSVVVLALDEVPPVSITKREGSSDPAGLPFRAVIQDSPLAGSHTAVMVAVQRVVSWMLRRCALDVAPKSSLFLLRFYQWLQTYYNLFSRSCHKCNVLLKKTRTEDGTPLELLPPVLRTPSGQGATFAYHYPRCTPANLLVEIQNVQ
jgi:Mediator complex subunit 27